MNRLVPLILVLGFSLAVVVSVWAAEGNPDQAKAVAEIERLGGKVIVDGKSPDKPVIGVHLKGTQVTDAGLESLQVLAKLQRLYLSNTKITDAGLNYLKGLTQLQYLDLWKTTVTDEGVKQLQQALPKCKIKH